MLSGLHDAVGIAVGAQGMSPLSGVSMTYGLSRLPLGKCTGLLHVPSDLQVDMAVKGSPSVVRQEKHEVWHVFPSGMSSM